MVNVCGRRREPRPAIGTIIFMLLSLRGTKQSRPPVNLFLIFNRKVRKEFTQSPLGL